MSDGVYGQLTTPEGLHRWIGQHLELQISRRAVCPGHSAPFEYLVRSYFEPSQDMVVWARAAVARRGWRRLRRYWI